jgi:hypothetical protein
LTLYAASSDGTIAVFNFDPEELEGIAPHSAQEQYLKKFDFVPPPVPEGYSHSIPIPAQGSSSISMRITPPPSPHSHSSPPRSQSHTGFGHTVNGGGERVNMLVAKRRDKKKVVPSAHVPIPSAENVDRPKVDSVFKSNDPPASRLALSSQLRRKSSTVGVSFHTIFIVLIFFVNEALHYPRACHRR